MYCKNLNFTKDALATLQPDTKSQYDVADKKVQGLRLRINPGGSKTFNVYKKIDGRQIRYKIGRFPEMSIENARKTALSLIARFYAGESPSDEKKAKRKELTFEELWEIYYREHALVNTKRPKDNKKMLEKHVLPVIGKEKLTAIGKEKIKQIHTAVWKLRYSGNQKNINFAHADRIITMVSAVFNFGLKEEYFKGNNPCIGVKKNTSISRDRFLTLEELKIFFDSVRQEESKFRDFFMLLLYTGARKSNVLSMRWDDINADLKRWRISEQESKNKDINIIALSDAALNILKSRQKENEKRRTPSPFVFPGDGKDGYLKDPKRAFQRIKEKMGVDDFRMHDLRRTLGSYMAISGASMPVIGKALNHKSQVSTAIYARLSQDPVLDALNNATAMMNK